MNDEKVPGGKGSSIDRKTALLNDEKVADEMVELSRSRP